MHANSLVDFGVTVVFYLSPGAAHVALSVTDASKNYYKINKKVTGT